MCLGTHSRDMLLDLTAMLGGVKKIMCLCYLIKTSCGSLELMDHESD